MNLLFFEDQYLSNSNVRFTLALRDNIPKLNIFQAYNVEWFEKYVHEMIFDVFILDIMTPETDIKSVEYKKWIPKSLIGIELSMRLRNNHYPNQKNNVCIIMRTARAEDSQIKQLCSKYGINYCFIPGSGDFEIIRILKKLNF